MFTGACEKGTYGIRTHDTRMTGKEIISVVYLYGVVNDSVKALAAESGYAFGTATNSGPVKFYHDLLEVRRTQIFPWIDKYGFWKKTQRWNIKYKQKIVE
jgi:hypothetical protein